MNARIYNCAMWNTQQINRSQVIEFTEKRQTAEGRINGAFFVLEPQVLDYIDSGDTPREYGPLPRLAADGQLMASQHEGFWQCMDTIPDKKLLEDLWAESKAPWKVW